MPVKNLVIVESPGKIKTISKFLGKDYKVMASMGHVRDLPKSKMGVDMENNFEPQYEVSKDKKKVITGLKGQVGKDTTVWIATDDDREGEAIGWHLTQALKLKKDADIKRIVFHEITKTAIQEAVANPRTIDMDKVNAQQARRVLDRLVGYTLSPLLWKKIKFGLSAGRVQSVAVRLIVDKERQIMAFNPEEYWSIVGKFTPENGKDAFSAKLTKKDGKKFVPSSEKETNEVLDAIDKEEYTVTSVEKKQTKRNPAPPFTTSTIQQEAARKLGFSVRKTMVIAQKLYEGIDLEEGHEGLITYMRTDSVSLSKTALGQAQVVIKDMYGAEYGLKEPRMFKGRKGAQEAHEAIRPTDLSRTPESLAKYLDKDLLRLYELIWKRTLACQMKEALLDKVGVDLSVKTYTFRATGQTINFPGFMKLYLEGHDGEKEGDDDKESILPVLTEGEHPNVKEIIPTQHFTKPPARYTEASLVKKLEEEGIGRPSTYAPTISTIQTREYIEKEGRQLRPTDIGFVVSDFLVEHFPQIVDYKFTVKMEEMLDEVEEGKETWQSEIKDFYVPFSKLVESKEGSVSREEASQTRELGIDPKSGRPVSVRIGRFGPLVQLGVKEDEVKPKFASLPEDKRIHDVELEDVLHLFDLPRTLGKTKEGEDVIVNIGRFGPYVKVGKEFTSIKEEDPFAVDLKRALEIVSDGAEAKKKSVIMEFPEEKIRVLIGPYGPYIKADKKNVKIPKTFTPEKLTLEDCKKIIAEAPAKKSFRKKKK